MTMRIFVPDETTACALGADDVVAALSAHVRAQGLEAELHRNGSRGAFHLEPLVEVETGGGRFGFANIDAASAPTLFAADGSPRLDHAACIGRVDDVAWLARQQRVTFKRIGRTVPLSLSDYRAHGGLVGLERALTMTGDAIIDAIAAAGLRGRGGAAFPAGRKWRTVRDTPATTKYVVCNADEGDSGTFADRLLMECDPFQLVEGMAIAGIATGATLGYIYLRSEYPKAIKVMERALAIARDAGILGVQVLGSAHAFDIELRIGAGSYVCGEETALLESLEGRRGVVRKKPPVPAIEGLFGKPTLVNNVLTLAAATSILADGAAAYAAHGSGTSRGTMPFQLAGAVARGGLVELPFGVTLRHLLDDFAGGSSTAHPLCAAQVGGPLGALLPTSQWDVPLDYERYAAAGAMLGHGGIVAFDTTTDFAAQAEFAMAFCARESCGKCTPCRIGAVRGTELIARMRSQPTPGQRALLDDLLETMEAGSLCMLGGLTPMPVRSILRWFPDALPPAAEEHARG